MAEKHEKPEWDDPSFDDAGETDGPAPPTEPASADRPEDPDPTEALRAERDALEQKLLRTAADYQNFVKRSAANLDAEREQVLLRVIKDLTTVLDHFDHALGVDPEKTRTADLLSGVTGIRDELVRVLGGYGMQKIQAEAGDDFDPNRHEAMLRQPHDDFANNQVIQQLQAGYALGEKTIRPAKVMVAE